MDKISLVKCEAGKMPVEFQALFFPKKDGQKMEWSNLFLLISSNISDYTLLSEVTCFVLMYGKSYPLSTQILRYFIRMNLNQSVPFISFEFQMTFGMQCCIIERSSILT